MPGTATHILELRVDTGVPTPPQTSDDPVAGLAAGEYGVQVVQRTETHGVTGLPRRAADMGANGADRLNDCQRSPRREACGAAVRGRTDGFMKIAGGSEGGPVLLQVVI